MITQTFSGTTTQPVQQDSRVFFTTSVCMVTRTDMNNKEREAEYMAIDIVNNSFMDFYNSSADVDECVDVMNKHIDLPRSKLEEILNVTALELVGFNYC